MGQVRIPLNEIAANGTTNHWYMLAPDMMDGANAMDEEKKTEVKEVKTLGDLRLKLKYTVRDERFLLRKAIEVPQGSMNCF